MRNYIATFVLILSSITCIAQNDDFYFTWVYDNVSNEPIEGATVSICHGGQAIESKETAPGGMVFFKNVFEPGVEYAVVIHTEGYILRYIPLSESSTSATGNRYNEFYLQREGGN